MTTPPGKPFRWKKRLWVSRDGSYGIGRWRGAPAQRFTLTKGASITLHKQVFQGKPAPNTLVRSSEIDSLGTISRRFVDARGRTVAQLAATSFGIPKNRIVILHSFAVLPSMRRAGLGNALGRLVFKEATERYSPRMIVAFIDPSNKAVRRVCQNNGFADLMPISRKDISYENTLKRMAATLYANVLTPARIRKLKIMVKQSGN
ncbi:GNAT family N-acetyltransferase [archaeon]|nr:GNAT family N-acetyltransferase [archaeon]